MNNYTYIAFIISFIWGISPVLFKFILQKNIPLYIIIFIQACVYLVSSLIYIIIYKQNNIQDDLYTHIKYIPIVIIISFFSIYVANFLYLFALENKANVNIMSLIVTLVHIITIIASFFILKETLSIKVLTGFLLIFIGLIFVFLPS